MKRVVAMVGLAAVTAAPPTWTPQSSGSTVRLRGVSAVDQRVAWASGQGGTVLRTADGGAHWQAVGPPNAGDLDLRDVDAVSADLAYALSIGPGGASRIFKTEDAGGHWSTPTSAQACTAGSGVGSPTR